MGLSVLADKEEIRVPIAVDVSKMNVLLDDRAAWGRGDGGGGAAEVEAESGLPGGAEFPILGQITLVDHEERLVGDNQILFSIVI